MSFPVCLVFEMVSHWFLLCSRPKDIRDVAHQEDVVHTLENSLKSGHLPHLLMYGPPGTGKTTSALAMVKQLFGPELVKSRVLELNASDERGIGVVRNKIKDFAATAVGSAVEGYPCPPFKVIILDEADSMTNDAQNALRRTMETYSRITRFIFICNYVSRIIEPLASRCAKFRFKPLQGEAIYNRVNYICSEEGVDLDNDSIKTLGRVAGGDMRKAITTLQSAFRLKGSPVTSATLLDVAGAVPSRVAKSILDTSRSASFKMIEQAVEEIIADGFPAQEVLLRLQELVLADDTISEKIRGDILIRLAEADKTLVDGADEYLQLLAVAASVQHHLLLA
jgi:replication factor C subunit 2/4